MGGGEGESEGERKRERVRRAETLFSVLVQRCRSSRAVKPLVAGSSAYVHVCLCSGSPSPTSPSPLSLSLSRSLFADSSLYSQVRSVD